MTTTVNYYEIEKDISNRMRNFFPETHYVKVNPGNVVMPQKYREIAEDIVNLPIYKDDVWIVSYPRTGSTWTQEMIWLLGNGLDFENAKKILIQRAPIIELTAIFSEQRHEWIMNSLGNSVECFKNTPRPRFARTHLPWDLLPKQMDIVKPKIIYTARNPKDLCVSFFHYFKLVNYPGGGSFEEFCDLFLNGCTMYGSYRSHILPFWKRRNDENVLFVKYEDMKKDLPEIIRKCANFLNVEYKLTEEKMKQICDHLNFKNMQSNPAVNLEPFINSENNNFKEEMANEKFIRKGKVGDWRNYMSEEISERFDRWIEEEIGETGLIFEYE